MSLTPEISPGRKKIIKTLKNVAKTLYKRKNYVQVMKVLKILMLKDNSGYGEYKLACMIYQGKGCMRTPELAKELFGRAAVKGHVKAMIYYAALLQEGREPKQEYARIWYKQAASKDHIDGLFFYANMLYDGVGGEKDLKGARQHYKLAADKGHPLAMSLYAQMCRGGLGGEVELSQAKEYYRRSAEKNISVAMYNYAIFLYEGLAGEKDLSAARRWLGMAAIQDYPAAMYNYGFMLLKGIGGNQDSETAREWLKAAAEKEHVKAMYTYGVMLQNGWGGDQDLVEAKKWLKLSATKGTPVDKYVYGLHLLQEDLASRDAEELITCAEETLPIVDFIMQGASLINEEQCGLLLMRLPYRDLEKLQSMNPPVKFKAIIDQNMSTRSLIQLASTQECSSECDEDRTPGNEEPSFKLAKRV